MRNKDQEKDVSSLIPDVRDEEGLLREELMEAQKAADELVEQARRSAEVSLKKLRLDLPNSVERLREKELRALQGELEAEREETRDATHASDELALSRMPAAVEHILTRVLPEGAG